MSDEIKEYVPCPKCDFETQLRLNSNHARQKAADELTSLRQRLAEVEGERDEAKAASVEWASQCGKAYGELLASEMACVVRGWQERADTAQSTLAAIREWVDKKNAMAACGPHAFVFRNLTQEVADILNPPTPATYQVGDQMRAPTIAEDVK